MAELPGALDPVVIGTTLCDGASELGEPPQPAIAKASADAPSRAMILTSVFTSLLLVT
jgi:hypothetical protein